VKERLRELLHGTGGGPAARNLAREFLQASILAALQRAGAMVPLAFQGGTALRFLYSIRRYSEDLDFALERAGAGYDFRAYLEAVRGFLRPHLVPERPGVASSEPRPPEQRSGPDGMDVGAALGDQLGDRGSRAAPISPMGGLGGRRTPFARVC
jgi:hypothetical protein